MTASEKSESKPESDEKVQIECGPKNGKDPDEVCFECKDSLAKSRVLINITGQASRRWHPECFKCMVCREPLDKRTSCHVYNDQIFCRSDYLRMRRDQSVKCKRCHWPISSSDWVRRAADYVYHLACFNCDICFRQLNTGEQFVINSQPVRRGDESRESEAADCKTIRLMCKLHFTVTESPDKSARDDPGLEAATGLSPSSDIPAVETSDAASKLDAAGSSIKVHCKQRQRPSPLRSDLLHLSAGASCSSSINRSDHRQASAQPLDQSQHHQAQQAQDPLAALHFPSKDYSPMVTSPSASNMNDTDAFTSHHHRVASSGSTASTTSSSTTLGCANGPMTPADCGAVGGLQSKSKRVRTTFTEDQLSILQTHFQIDSNPDGQDLERIATITGLSKRVTQVWFQNSRARQKKYMIKKKPHAHSSAVASMSSLSHSHHHNQLHNQHNIQQGLAMINQEMGGSGGLPSSPAGLELIGSPDRRLPTAMSGQHRTPTNDFSRQFDWAPYARSGAPPEQPRSTADKENEELHKELEIDLSRGDEDELLGSSSDDDTTGLQIGSPQA